MVLGRVSLWGRVVECDHGWRSEHAHPAARYLSTCEPKPAWRFRRHATANRRPALEQIARLLRTCRVPVRPIADDSLADVAAAARRLSGTQPSQTHTAGLRLARLARLFGTPATVILRSPAEFRAWSPA